MNENYIYFCEKETPIGKLIITANHNYFLSCEFSEHADYFKHLKERYNLSPFLDNDLQSPLNKLSHELDLYFSGKLKNFTTPIKIDGTYFQKKAWEVLKKIPYGSTISYSVQSERMGNVKSFRAVGNANRKNRLMIIIPCHRVISKGRKIGGYSGGIDRKKWLIDFEKRSNQHNYSLPM
jgi:O-6-methylguanine DNA methyltransferase